MLHELQTIGIGTLSQVAKKPVVLIGETSPSLWGYRSRHTKTANQLAMEKTLYPQELSLSREPVPTISTRGAKVAFRRAVRRPPAPSAVRSLSCCSFTRLQWG